MCAYVIFQGDVTNETLYEDYKKVASATVAHHGGVYLVRGGQFVSLEGKEPASRTVVIRFESIEAAQAWYNSADYSEARPIRQAASTGALYLVEG